MGTKVQGTTTQGSIPYEDSSGNVAMLSPGAVGTVLVSGGTGANPSFNQVTFAGGSLALIIALGGS